MDELTFYRLLLRASLSRRGGFSSPVFVSAPYGARARRLGRRLAIVRWIIMSAGRAGLWRPVRDEYRFET